MIKVFLSTSLIFLVIVVVRKVFRGRAGNVFLYSLWLLFAAGLVFPIFSFALQNIMGWEYGTIKSPVSIMNIVKIPATDAVGEDNFVGQKEILTEKEEKNEGKRQADGINKKAVATVNDKKEIIGAEESEGFFVWTKVWHWKDKFSVRTESWQFKWALIMIWAVGAITILLWQFFLERMFRRRLTENREEVICRGQKVYRTKGIRTPLLFRSRGLSLDIYLPETVTGNETLVNHAVLHEKIHKKHGDIWWGYLRNVLVAIYWFDPIVWMAAILSKRDCEYACDSSVMKDMSRKERISYGNSLLSLIQAGENRDLFCTATAMKLKKSEIEVRIRMIKRGRKRNIFVTVFILVVLCGACVAAFTDAMEPKKENAEEEQLSFGKPEQAKVLTAKEAEYDITDLWGADPPYICYEDDTKMIFSGCFGLFVYSKEKEEIVQSLDLKEIGCNMTQGDDYCDINVSEDGKTVYLHVMKDEKMYQYSVDTRELQYVDYNLPKNLFDRKQWEKENQSGIQLNSATIGDLVYYYDDGAKMKYQPLFYRPYGSCTFFGPEDIT